MLAISPAADWLLALRDWRENGLPDGLAALLREGDGRIPDAVREALGEAIARALDKVTPAGIRAAAIAATAGALLPPDQIPPGSRAALAELVAATRPRGRPSSVTELQRHELHYLNLLADAGGIARDPETGSLYRVEAGTRKAMDAELRKRFPGIPAETLRHHGKSRKKRPDR